MKICIIHGSPRKGNTLFATEIFKEALQKQGEYQFTEFFLPKDLPRFCHGCYVCFEKGEDKCPNAGYVQPIATAIREADGLVITSPVYSLAESAAVKTLLDHLSYNYMNHRPTEEMFSKVAMVITTTAGYGTNHAIKPIRRTFRYWGMRRITSLGLTIFAKEWVEMDERKQQKFKSLIARKAQTFSKMLVKRKQLQPMLFTRFFFQVCKRLISGYTDDHPDKIYWKQQGWLDKKRPF